jgi:hypothetical protein
MKIPFKPVCKKFSEELYIIRGGSIRHNVERDSRRKMEISVQKMVNDCLTFVIGYGIVYEVESMVSEEFDEVF